jgi:hypothetical protein
MGIIYKDTLEGLKKEFKDLLHRYNSDLGGIDIEAAYNHVIAMQNSELYHLFIAVKDNKIIGIFTFFIVYDPFTSKIKGVEEHWYVDKENRGCGLGLYERFVKRCKENEVQELEMHSKDEQLDGFYKVEKFNQVGKQFSKEI